MLRHKGVAILGIFIKTVATLSELALPLILEHIIDNVAPTGNLNMMIFWGAAMILISVAAFILNINANRLASLVAR